MLKLKRNNTIKRPKAEYVQKQMRTTSLNLDSVYHEHEYESIFDDKISIDDESSFQNQALDHMDLELISSRSRG